MTNQKIAVTILQVLIILFVVTSLPKMYDIIVQPKEKGTFVVTSQGVVTDVALVAYPCKANSSSTCKQYEVTINDERIIVEEATYLRAIVGKEITLGNYQKETGFLSFFHVWLSSIVILFNLLYILSTFVFWALCESNTKSFKNYLKGLY